MSQSVSIYKCQLTHYLHFKKERRIHSFRKNVQRTSLVIIIIIITLIKLLTFMY
jgi:hypothetical protein